MLNFVIFSKNVLRFYCIPRISISAKAEAMIASSHNLNYLGRKIPDNNKKEVIS